MTAEELEEKITAQVTRLAAIEAMNDAQIEALVNLGEHAGLPATERACAEILDQWDAVPTPRQFRAVLAEFSPKPEPKRIDCTVCDGTGFIIREWRQCGRLVEGAYLCVCRQGASKP